MANIANFVARIRQDAAAVEDALALAFRDVDQYTALGGSAALAQTGAGGVTWTQSDVQQADIIAAINTFIALRNLLSGTGTQTNGGHATNLANARS